jgi:isopentenyl-diphosphate delta-isomerase
MITGMTGGYSEASQINRDLALACEEKNVAFGLGSQRAMIEDPSLAATFKVKDEAPEVLLCGNIGASQLAKYCGSGKLGLVIRALEAVEADALCVHLNALQEAVQPEGDRDWSGVAAALKKTCAELRLPVIVKETGAGMSAKTAKGMEALGAKALDISGSGGTSWAAVELERAEKEEDRLDEFRDWGIPAAESLKECAREVGIPLVASGGLRNGLDVARAVRLGAALGGAAYPFLKAQEKGGKAAVSALISKWERSLKTAMFLTNSANLAQLAKAPMREKQCCACGTRSA